MGSEVFTPRSTALLAHGRAPLPQGLIALLSRAGFVVTTRDTFESLPRALAIFSPAVVVLVMSRDDRANWRGLATRLHATRVVVVGHAPPQAARAFVALDIVEFFEDECTSRALTRAACRLAPV